MQTSMSRRGNCYDYAPIESFCGTLRTELLYTRRFATRVQARQAITKYIGLFYNRQRTRAGLDCLSPAAFTARYYTEKMAV
ncbi:transposase (plasmid) [Cupriavidus necator]|nr:transposase [Cupriavidus necator]